MTGSSDNANAPAANRGVSGETGHTPWIQRVVRLFVQGNLSVIFLILAFACGGVALLITPREEEPQIVVPLADVLIQVPGASAEEVERQVATQLEKLLYQIDGVEYVYSMSREGSAIVTVRFYVGEDREDSLVKIYNKINSNINLVPESVAGWVIKPIEIDDVPIVNVTLFSDRYNDHELRRLAEEVEIKLQACENTNQIFLIGGRPRRIRVELDPARLAAHSLSPLEVVGALQVSNTRLQAGNFEATNRVVQVDAGDFLPHAEAARELVVGVEEGKPVRLRDVATVIDGPAEVETYTRIGFGPSAQDIPESLRNEALGEGRLFSAVNVAVAKKKGSNAVWVAEAIKARMKELEKTIFPDGVYYRITRDYGVTANNKVNELVEGLFIAIVVVIGLLGLALGWREAIIVGVAVPITFALALMVNYLLGFTINRVTLFALTLALGIVVDDPIVCVDNITRHFSMRREPPFRAVLSAMTEILPPVILTTVAVVASFAPMFFITGMMGPYMQPMAFNVPVALCFSTVVALTITPWLAYHVLKGGYGKEAEPWDIQKSPVYKFYRRFLPIFLDSRIVQFLLFLVVIGLFAFAGWLAMERYVPLKMLPFDNKNEFQIVVDMPEGTTLEMTDAATNALAEYLRTVPEVTDFQTYVGTASPMDFNGMVRHYYLRQGPNVADIRINLVSKDLRAQQSHPMTLRLRDDLAAIAREHNANIKVVETPPGPPVIATVTAEIRGQDHHSYKDLIGAARVVRQRMEREPGVVDIDDSVETDQVRYRFVTDKEKAALNGVSTQDVARTIRLALEGSRAGILRHPDEVHPLGIDIRLPRGIRSGLGDLSRLYVSGPGQQLVTLGELGHFEEDIADKTIYHKNLEPVVYVFAEMAGRAPAAAILDIQGDRVRDADGPTGVLEERIEERPLEHRSYLKLGAGIPWRLSDAFDVNWAGEGEWQITLRVFRDLGLAFGAACIGIYVILVYQTGSYFMPLILMISIPLTMIGIMPGFWVLNLITNRPVGGYATPVFFTATAMIGMIALSGIAVRNAILLIEFIHDSLREGLDLRESLLRSGAARLRPIFLTASTAGLAAFPITLDPIFSGLAWALIFGLTVSTAFTLLLIPVVYWVVYRNRPGHGLVLAPDESLENVIGGEDSSQEPPNREDN